MTDNEWILICLVAMVMILAAILLHSYPMGEAINGTYAMVAGGP